MYTQPTQVKYLCYNLIPVQYTELTHQIKKFLILPPLSGTILPPSGPNTFMLIIVFVNFFIPHSRYAMVYVAVFSFMINYTRHYSWGAQTERWMEDCVLQLQCTEIYSSVLQCTAEYCIVLLCTALYCSVLHCTVVYCIVL